MRRPPFLALVAACGLALVAGCAQADEDPLALDPTDTSAPPGGREDDGPTALDVIEVLDPGVAPRSMLLLQPPAGCEQSVHQGSEQDLTQSIEGSRQSTSVSSGFDSTYRCTRTEGDEVEISSSSTNLQVSGSDPRFRAGAQKAFETLLGHPIHTTFDRSGNLVRSDAALATGDVGPDERAVIEALLDSSASALAPHVVPFPKVPLGVGARWTQRSAHRSGGLRMRQVDEYTITSIDADRIVASLATTATAVAGPMDVGGLLPSGAEIRVRAGYLAGSGTVTWPRNAVVTYVDQTLDGSFQLTATIAGDEVDLFQSLHQRLVITARPTTT